MICIVSVCIHVCVCMSVCVRIYIYIYLYMFLYMYIRILTYFCSASSRACHSQVLKLVQYIDIYTHINTHKNTYILSTSLLQLVYYKPFLSWYCRTVLVPYIYIRYACVYVCIYTYACINIYACGCICIYLHVCVYVFICIHYAYLQCLFKSMLYASP